MRPTLTTPRLTLRPMRAEHLPLLVELDSEGAVALLSHGFGSAGLGVVFAETMAVNLGSRGVMARLGMRHVRTEQPDFPEALPDAEQGEVIYEITAEEWASTKDGP